MTDPPEDLTPSAKLVWFILDTLEGEAHTAEEITDASFAPRRTVNDALRELCENGFVERQDRPQSPTYRVSREFRVTAGIEER